MTFMKAERPGVTRAERSIPGANEESIARPNMDHGGDFHKAEYVRQRDAARIAGVSTRTIQNWVASGRISASRPSQRLTLIRLEELRAFLGGGHA